MVIVLTLTSVCSSDTFTFKDWFSCFNLSFSSQNSFSWYSKHDIYCNTRETLYIVGTSDAENSLIYVSVKIVQMNLLRVQELNTQPTVAGSNMSSNIVLCVVGRGILCVYVGEGVSRVCMCEEGYLMCVCGGGVSHVCMWGEGYLVSVCGWEGYLVCVCGGRGILCVYV